MSERQAHAIPLDDERDVMTPIGAQLLEGLPQRRRRKDLVARDQPDLEESRDNARAQSLAKIILTKQ